MKPRILSLLLAAVLAATLFPGGALAADSPPPKLVAITFDDGPSPYTSQLLDGLAARSAHATFFMSGVNGSYGAANHADKLARMVKEGHQLANHTYSHANFGALSAQSVRSETDRVETLLVQAMGCSYIDMVRTPGGAVNNTIRQNVNAPIILWSVDTLDWKNRNADSVYNRIISGAQDGSIVLLHDIYPTSVEGALRAIDTLQSKGYEFVTVAELMRRRGVTPQNGVVYNSVPAKGADLPAYSAPAIAASPNVLDQAVQVRFSAPESGLTFYYTTDGSQPTPSSRRYTAPVTITRDTTFTVVGIDAYGTRTPVAKKTVQAAFAPQPVPALEDGLLRLTAPDGIRIHYTTDGSIPTADSPLYTAPFVPGDITRCIAMGDGMYNSAILTGTLTAYGDLFTDVPADVWYYDVVGEAVHSGLMQGMGDCSFAPGGAMTRAMLVTVLWRDAGSPVVNYLLPFTDVEPEQYYTEAVRWAASTGLVTGLSETEFAPDAAVTRQQLAVLLARSADAGSQAPEPETAYADLDQIAGYAQDGFFWCLSNGVLNGTDTGELLPAEPATRVQCCAALLRLAALE